MSVQLDHTVVPAVDAHAAAEYLAEMLDLPAPQRLGHFWQVDLDNGVGLDFADTPAADIPHMHLAFLVSEAQFTATYARITSRGITTEPSRQARRPSKHSASVRAKRGSRLRNEAEIG